LNATRFPHMWQQMSQMFGTASIHALRTHVTDMENSPLHLRLLHVLSARPCKAHVRLVISATNCDIRLPELSAQCAWTMLRKKRGLRFDLVPFAVDA